MNCFEAIPQHAGLPSPAVGRHWRLISINASDAPTQPVDRALVTTHLQHLEGELALP
jgi:hypothetical protein